MQVALLLFTACVAEQSLIEKLNVWRFNKKNFFLASLFEYEDFFFSFFFFQRKNNVLLIVG